MDDWEKNLQEAMEAFATTIDSLVEDIEQTLGEVAESIEEELGAEWHWFWQEWSDFWEEVNPFDNDLDDWSNSEDRRSGNSPQDYPIVPWSPLDGDPGLGINPYLPATPRHQPACQGCQHYHGYVYGGKLLVCGMHPYGSDGEECPDWQELEK